MYVTSPPHNDNSVLLVLSSVGCKLCLQEVALAVSSVGTRYKTGAQYTADLKVMRAVEPAYMGPYPDP